MLGKGFTPRNYHPWGGKKRNVAQGISLACSVLKGLHAEVMVRQKEGGQKSEVNPCKSKLSPASASSYTTARIISFSANPTNLCCDPHRNGSEFDHAEVVPPFPLYYTLHAPCALYAPLWEIFAVPLLRVVRLVIGCPVLFNVRASKT